MPSSIHKRILVVGCGYLGERVTRLWKRQGHDIRVLTRSAEKARRITSMGMQACVGDVTCRESLHVLDEMEPGYLMLYAVGFDRSSSRSKREVYVDGLRNVLESAGPRLQRAIYISSTSVYGQTDGEWIDEQFPCDPITEGGRICRDAEQVFADCCRTSGLSGRTLRMAGLYGPGRMLRRAELVRQGEPISGRSHALLNLIHIDDAARAVTLCAEQWPESPVLNLSDGSPITRESYYAKLAALLDGPTPEFQEVDGANQRTPGLNKRIRNELAKSQLGWTPHYSVLSNGLRHALTKTP